MALGLEVALVLRARGGANFLTQTQGLGIKDSIDATAEVLRVLQQYSSSDGRPDTDGQGDSAPGYASGQLLVCNGRLLVLYRLVNSVWVMTVTPATTNVLLCSQLISATTRLLVTACKGIDVTPDRIARKYPEIYIATGQLLCLGGLSLDSGSILASAESDVASLSPENKLKPKGTTAAVKSRLGLGNRRPLPSAPSASHLAGSSPDPSVTPRTRAEEGELFGTPFVLPAEALSPQAQAQTPAATPDLIESSQPANDGLDDLFGPAVPIPGSEFLAGTGLETLEAPTRDYSSFANLRPPPPPPVAAQNPWAEFDAIVQPEAKQEPAAAAAAKPALPPPTSKQQRSIANGNALQLVELWKAFFVGATLATAGTFGEVLASGTVPQCAAEIALRLQPPDSEPEADGACDLVSVTVEAVQGEAGLADSAPDGSIVAKMAGASSREAAFAKYQLPAMAVQPPVLLGVSIAEKPKRLPPPRNLVAPSPQPLTPQLEPPGHLSPRVSPFQQAAHQRSSSVQIHEDEGESENGEDYEDAIEQAKNGAELTEMQDREEDFDETPETTVVPANGHAEEDAAPDIVNETSSRQDNATDSQEGQDIGALSDLTGVDGEAVKSAPEAALEAPPETEAEAKLDAAMGGSALDADIPEQSQTKAMPGPANAPTLPGESAASPVSLGEEAANPVTPETAAVSSAPAESAPREYMVLVRLAVRSDLPGPMRGVCVDLDLHSGLGKVLSPAADLKLRVICTPSATGQAFDRACSATVASLHAFGPPSQSLSGVQLLSGTLGADLKHSRQAFHCEVYARPHIPKRRAELTKQDMLAMALQMYQKQLKQRDAGILERGEAASEPDE